MEDNLNITRRRMTIPLILSQLLYSALFFSMAQGISTTTVMVSLLLVLTATLVYGSLWGFLSGLAVGVVQIISMAVRQKFDFSVSSIQLTSFIFSPDLLSSALLPFWGLFVGLFAEKTGIHNTRLIGKARSLQAENQDLSAKLEHYEQQFQDLSPQKLYRRSWESQFPGDSRIEHVISLLIASAKPEASVHCLLKPGLPIPSALEKEPSSHLFELFLQVRPDALAVFDLTGKIIHINETLMAICGYKPEERSKTVYFLDLLLPAEVEKAAVNMTRAAKSELKRDEHYQLNSSDGGFLRLPIPSQVRLECMGSPLTLVAYVSKPDRILPDDGAAADESGPLDLAELIHQDILCLSADHQITYVSPALSETLGEEPLKMVGQPVLKFISRRQSARFTEYLEESQKSSKTVMTFEMTPHQGKRTIFQHHAFPSIGANGTYLGMTLLLENVTSVTLVEEALQHRLSMEKLISTISTRFISIRADEMDWEIQHVIKLVGDFEEAEESLVEIFQSKRVRSMAKFHVVNKKVSSKQRSAIGYGQSQESDRFETVNIPIVIESETLGYFRFYLEQYRTNWFETDLELIRLIGEIIINALIRKENEQNIKLNENRLSTTLHSIGDAVIATDTQGRIIVMNRKAEILTGWSTEAALYKPLDDVFKPFEDPTPVENDAPDVQNLHHFSETDDSMILQSTDGRSCFISINRNAIEDLTNEVYGEVIVFRDVTQEKQENDEIRYISYHDKLTGLYNRAFFEEELSRLNTQRQYPITLILGDCNGLKIANDIFGHLEGDRLLQTIANILRSATRHEDIVARWGGDEFAIILPRTDEQAASAFRDRILQLCAEAECNPIQPSLALGSATNTDGSNDLVGLLKLAEDRMYRHKLMEGKSARSSILMSIEKMIYEKSYETEEHASRLADISQKIGHAIGLSDFELEELSLLSVLHDMGKIGIPDHILLKPERLSEEEWEVMKKHSEKGYNLAKSTPELNSIAESILHHHEHWDGTGYPSGLRGGEIPKLSRILAIVDAYDVITHSRSYKKAQSKIDALLEIKKCSGTQFDPELSQIFVDIMDEGHRQPGDPYWVGSISE